MSKQSQEIKIVSSLKSAMLKILREKSHKPHWRDVSINDLIKNVERHIHDLEVRLLEMSLEDAKQECANVAIDIAMIYDNISQKFLKKRTLDGSPSLNIQMVVNRFFAEVYDVSKKGGKQIICGRLNVTLPTISTWRKGEVVPRIETLDEMWMMIMDAQNDN